MPTFATRGPAVHPTSAGATPQQRHCCEDAGSHTGFKENLGRHVNYETLIILVMRNYGTLSGQKLSVSTST